MNTYASPDWPALAVLLAAWQDRSNPMRWWSWLLLAGLLLAFPPLMLLLLHPQAALFFMQMMAGLALALAWSQLVASTFRQNHPTLARLLPGHVRRLKLTLVLPFLGLGLAAQWLAPHWGWSAGGLTIVLALCFVALANRWPLLWAASGFIGFAPLLGQRLAAATHGLTVEVLHGFVHGLGFALVLAGGAWMLSRMIGAGGADHEAGYAKAQARRKAAREKSGGNPTCKAGWIQRWGSRAYGRSLATLLARRDNSFERLALALGPGAHRLQTRAGVFVLGLVLLVVIASLRLFGVFDLSDKVAAGLANTLFGLVGVQLGVISTLHGSMVQRQREQALVSLLPGVPRGAAFNRALGLWLLRQYCVSWAIGMGMLTLWLCAFPGTHAALLSFGLATLACGLMLWGNWARRPRLGLALTVLLYLPAVLIAVAGRYAVERGVISMGGFVVLMLLLLAPLAWWRWRVMVGAPMAWPAGRR